MKIIKVLILGNTDKYSDEAQKNITKRLIVELSRNHKVKYENARENLFNILFWKRVLIYSPDIIHIFLRPTLLVLCYAFLFKIFYRRSKVVISAFQPPRILAPFCSLIGLLKPHLFIVLSNSMKSLLEEHNVKAMVLRCGVDSVKFSLIGDNEKQLLRKKYSIPSETYVILHVGHATKGRNLKILEELTEDGIQVIFVCSRSFNLSTELMESLKESGCLVISEYLENVEVLYQLADCYVFPTLCAENSVELPLSIIEAMACNLPIITTPFGALPELFQEDDSLMFFDGTSPALSVSIENMRKGLMTVNNRAKINDFDWGIASQKLEDIYQGLISGDKR